MRCPSFFQLQRQSPARAAILPASQEEGRQQPQQTHARHHDHHDQHNHHREQHASSFASSPSHAASRKASQSQSKRTHSVAAKFTPSPPKSARAAQRSPSKRATDTAAAALPVGAYGSRQASARHVHRVSVASGSRSSSQDALRHAASPASASRSGRRPPQGRATSRDALHRPSYMHPYSRW